MLPNTKRSSTPTFGLMQQFPLLVSRLLRYAERFHGDTEIVSRCVNGEIHRYTYSAMASRCRKLANALRRLEVSAGDVVATIAWNGFRHMELYYAVPGIQAVYHTINPRLSDAQLTFVINNAKDKYVFAEPMFSSSLERVSDEIQDLKGIVFLCGEEDMPDTSLPNVYCYETLLANEDDDFDWQDFDENAAAGICYTSGTTGDPKGVVYTHRSLLLQAMNSAIGLELSSRDTILPIVPMFHVNAWALPFTAAMLGAKFVLPGNQLDGKNVFELLDNEKVTFSAGVPTVWQMLFDYLESSRSKLPYLSKAGIGGSAATRTMLETFLKQYDVDPLHAWGMTETSAMGTSPTPTARVVEKGEDAELDAKLTQGRAMFGSEVKVVDDAGNDLPMDGESAGELCIRGWAVASGYLNGSGADAFTDDGWFRTGDVATIDAGGYVRLTDRVKDVIKSGGEWISSVALEDAAAGHAGVSMAAVVGVPHPKWDERPLLVVVAKPGHELDKHEILEFMGREIPKWWLPNDVVVVDQLPIGSTGKVLKNVLREKYGDFFS